MKTFDAQLRLRSARTEAQRNQTKWDVWEEFVWTPGYVTTYAQVKHEIAHWPGDSLNLRRALKDHRSYLTGNIRCSYGVPGHMA
jgi:hypothetical protein